jgi:hypothetical protein
MFRPAWRAVGTAGRSLMHNQAIDSGNGIVRAGLKLDAVVDSGHLQDWIREAESSGRVSLGLARSEIGDAPEGMPRRVDR